MTIDEIKQIFPENLDSDTTTVGYCYVTFCHRTDEFYVGKKHAKKFIDTYYGSGAAPKYWKVCNYDLSHWPVSWAHTEDELNQQEFNLVKSAQMFKDCANKKAGGGSPMSGRKHSPETIQKMRESAKKIKHQPMSQETKDKISAANMGKHNKTEEQRKAVGDFHRGRKRSAETCEKIGLAKRGEKHPFYGKSRSEETKAKIAASNIGKHNKKQ